MIIASDLQIFRRYAKIIAVTLASVIFLLPVLGFPSEVYPSLCGDYGSENGRLKLGLDMQGVSGLILDGQEVSPHTFSSLVERNRYSVYPHLSLRQQSGDLIVRINGFFASDNCGRNHFIGYVSSELINSDETVTIRKLEAIHLHQDCAESTCGSEAPREKLKNHDGNTFLPCEQIIVP